MDASAAQSDPPQTGGAPTLARRLAPEDVRVGAYVAVLDCTYQVPSFFWCGEESWRRDDVALLRLLPESERLVTLRVAAVCLPFVLTKSPAGVVQTLDLRQVRLARLDDGYAKRAWKLLKPRRPKNGAKRRLKKSRRKRK